MDTERLKKIEEIYHAALGIPENKRESFFKEHCGDDENLRREVESLLAFEKTFDNFLDAPPELLAAEMFSEQEKEASFVNKEFGHYKVKKLLGKGGMGEVYLAEDTRLNRRVALKFLSGSISADQNRLRRFEREAFSASALNHPNILTIYEFGKENETHFLASEFVEGETLRQLFQGGELPLKRILRVAEQTALALSAAHKAGIVHRDIKPENIMIRHDDGIVKVLDFGLAKLTKLENSAVETDSEAATRALLKTHPGMVMGTVSYMSPEQTRGLADIDARTDIWSLGVVLFEMLTGKTPFEGETMNDVIASILKSDVPQISKFIPNCPPEIERIIEKTLQKDREERYQVIKDLALDLKTLRKEMEFSAQFNRVSYSGTRNPTSEIPKQQLTVAENVQRASAPKYLLILLVVGLIFGGAWWFFVRNAKQTATTETAALKTSEIVNWNSSPSEFYSVGSFSPDAKMIAFASTKSGGKNIWIKQTNSGEAIQVTKDEFRNEQPIWSPNGEELAFFSTRGNQTGIWRIPLLGGSPKFVATVEDGGSLLRFWSKKELIYYESNHDIFAIDVNSGQTKQITDFDSRVINAESINISHDEQRISYTTVDDDLWNLWTKNLPDGEPQKLFSAANEIKNTAWHTDNQRILYSALVDGSFQIFATDINAAPPQQITFTEKDAFVLDVSADGTKILYGSAKEESDIWSVNLKDSKESIAASDINAELWANAAPDGKSIAYQAIKNLSQGNNLFNGKILIKKLGSDEQPTEISGDGYLPVWSPDGQTIAFIEVVGNNHRIETVKVAGGSQKQLAADNFNPVSYTLLPYNRIQTNDLSWSPDSSQIAYISKRSGQLNIWLASADGSNNLQLTDNTDTKLFLYCPIWSADGKQIAFTSKTGNSAGKPTFSVSLIDVKTKISKQLTQQKAFFRLIGWEQSEKKLFLVSTDDTETRGLQTEVSLLQMEIETGKIQTVAALKDVYLANIYLAPDKKNIAFAAHREGKDNIWLIPANGGEAKKLTDNNDSRLYFSSLAWSPDSNSIFFGKQLRYSLLSMLTNFK